MDQQECRSNMVNEDFEPSDRQENLLDVLTEGMGSGQPWGWASVKRFSEETGLRRQYVSRELEALEGAGWVERPYRGLYRFVDDPRIDISPIGACELREFLARILQEGTGRELPDDADDQQVEAIREGEARAARAIAEQFGLDLGEA